MKPDPAQSIDTSGKDDKAARSARKMERIKAWKRESKKTDRVKAAKERIADWCAATGLEWPS